MFEVFVEYWPWQHKKVSKLKIIKCERQRKVEKNC